VDEAHVGLDADDDADGLDEVVEGYVGAQPAALVDDAEDVLDLDPDVGERLGQALPDVAGIVDELIGRVQAGVRVRRR
jgi:hypothetical protein